MSRIYVPPSQDTLFMRGFSYHHRIEDIKDFFVREAGRCMVEFNKDDGSDGQYVALKFESRDVAKEVYRRFNDREILGDRISMTWYKDLRRIKRMNASRRYQRGGFYGSDQYEYRGSYQRSGYQRSHYRPTSSSRMRKYSRSSSRSRSASRSPTQSRSRSRSSSRSYDSRDFKKKRSASSGFDQHGKSSIRKRMRYTRNEGYESSESMNQKKMERKKNDGTLVEGIDNKTMENVENNASMIDSNQSMGMNDGVETSPQHKAAAVRSLVQKKVEESKFAPVPSEDRQAVSSENQNHNATDAQKELNESDRNILELHPSDDEELEIEDNIDEASLVSLNFSNPAPEQPNKELSFAGTVNVEEVQNEKEVQQVNNTSRVSLENGSTLESCRQAADKSMVSFDLHVQQRKDAIAGLSYEKLKLMKEKKEEIEKAYRQDCETLVMVTKLLVSKDPELEDRIQNSLRENLREIGHRCIQELKEFVEKVKTDEEF